MWSRLGNAECTLEHCLMHHTVTNTTRSLAALILCVNFGKPLGMVGRVSVTGQADLSPNPSTIAGIS